MGKKRVIQKSDTVADSGRQTVSSSLLPKKRLSEGLIHIQSTYNNTIVSISDFSGNIILSSSAGALGFKGAKKSTPYAATSAVEAAIKKARDTGVKIVEVFIKGPGVGRDAALRAIRNSGLSVAMIADITPIPHNGPRMKKKRRV